MIPRKWRNIARFTVFMFFVTKYAGGAPLVWSLLNNEKKTGITLFKLQDGVDEDQL